jgi:Ca-activated chloride channel homolog
MVSFRAPEVLWLLAAAPVALLFLQSRESRRLDWTERFAAAAARRPRRSLRLARPAVLAVAFALAVSALAGPRWGRERIEVHGSTANRVLILDISNSMLAEDVGTSRLTAAKAIGRRIIDEHQGRIGLVVFEGAAEIISPLTTDGEAVVTLLESLEAGETGEPGSSFAAGIREALRLVNDRPSEPADFILISDGEERGGQSGPAAQEAAARAVRIRTVMLGQPAGASIPIRDEQGRQVVTSADPSTLAAIARATGGRAYENPFGADALRDLAGPPARTAAAGAEEVEIPIERFQWPLAASLGLLLLGSLLHRGAE